MSTFIKQLQELYEKHGDMPVIAGHLDNGIEQSWNDEIPYEFYRHFTQLSPAVTSAVTEDYQTDGEIQRSIRWIEVPNGKETMTFSTDVIESLPHSIHKTLHHSQEQNVLCLHLTGLIIPKDSPL